MLLAIDVGNTETVLGVFQGAELSWHWRIATRAERTADELALLFGGFLEQKGLSFTRQITGVALASVVPDQTQALREMVRRYFHFSPVVLEPGVRTGMPILYDNPKEVGADRIANAVAAYERYGGPAVVVDMGTATTFDVISAEGQYLGGAIAPGIRISAEALFGATARLSRVEIVPPRSVIGKNTVESIQAGLVLGTASMIDGVIERIEKDLGDATVVATGGLATVVMDHCTAVDHHDPWLTLEGLRLIYERNAGPDA
ncbi:MAG TPA: type III pantothenate kinase [Acidimicrobiia bacterium]